MLADGAEELEKSAVRGLGEDLEGGVCLKVNSAAVADGAESGRHAQIIDEGGVTGSHLCEGKGVKVGHLTCVVHVERFDATAEREDGVLDVSCDKRRVSHVEAEAEDLLACQLVEIFRNNIHASDPQSK